MQTTSLPLSSPFATNPVPVLSVTQDLTFATRMPGVRRAGEAARELTPGSLTEITPRAAFELLVSAACYISTAPALDTASSLEAVHLLHDLSQEFLDGGPELGGVSRETEDLVWQSKQVKWERQRSVEAAIRFVRGASEVRQAARARQRQSLWSRLLGAWRGAPQVQPF